MITDKQEKTFAVATLVPSGPGKDLYEQFFDDYKENALSYITDYAALITVARTVKQDDRILLTNFTIVIPIQNEVNLKRF